MAEATPIETEIKLSRLKTLAASGSSGLARKAQTRLREIVHADLRQSVARSSGSC